MIGHMIPLQKPNVQHELTPRDDAKKVVSEVLKRVDQLIRKGDLDRAQMEISNAKELDPRNVYALALEERISILKAEVEQIEDVRRTKEIAHPPIVKDETKPDKEAAVTLILVKPIAPSVDPAPTPAAPVVEKAPASIALPAPEKPRELPRPASTDRSCELDSYKKALAEAWEDGALTSNEERQLSELRVLLEVTDSEHERLEKAVKCECYRNSLFRILSDHTSIGSHTKSLSFLKGKFQISEEEHERIQGQMMNTVQHKQRDKVLVIDDDVRLLDLLAASLDDSGFDVTALPTSDEAYALLRKFIPDLILCDINLETSTMGGFTFYEKVQELKNVQSVPFVFLTGLTDEALVRTGKELGVDDYLMKPISEQTLVSTLRGKLKRFKQLKRYVETPAPMLALA